MKGIFSLDSPLYKFMEKFGQIVLLNILFIVFSLPIVTIGASLAATFYTAMKMGDDEEGYIFKTFMKGFKENFKQGTMLFIIFAAGIYILYIYKQVADISNSFILITLFILAVVIFVQGMMYSFPLIVRYDNTIPRTIQNSFEIALKHPLTTIFIMLLIAIEVALFTWNETMLFLGLFIGIPVLVYTEAVMSKRVFAKIEED